MLKEEGKDMDHYEQYQEWWSMRYHEIDKK